MVDGICPPGDPLSSGGHWRIWRVLGWEDALLKEFCVRYRPEGLDFGDIGGTIGGVEGVRGIEPPWEQGVERRPSI